MLEMENNGYVVVNEVHDVSFPNGVVMGYIPITLALLSQNFCYFVYIFVL